MCANMIVMLMHVGKETRPVLLAFGRWFTLICAIQSDLPGKSLRLHALASFNDLHDEHLHACKVELCCLLFLCHEHIYSYPPPPYPPPPPPSVCRNGSLKYFLFLSFLFFLASNPIMRGINSFFYMPYSSGPGRKRYLSRRAGCCHLKIQSFLSKGPWACANILWFVFTIMTMGQMKCKVDLCIFWYPSLAIIRASCTLEIVPRNRADAFLAEQPTASRGRQRQREGRGERERECVCVCVC